MQNQHLFLDRNVGCSVGTLGAAIVAGVATTTAENSEVLPAASVAVAVMNSPAATVTDKGALNVALPLLIAGLDYQEIGKRVRAALDMVGLLSRERSWPGMLSGGEQQRAADLGGVDPPGAVGVGHRRAVAGGVDHAHRVDNGGADAAVAELVLDRMHVARDGVLGRGVDAHAGAAAEILMRRFPIEGDGGVRYRILRALGRLQAGHPEIVLDAEVLGVAAEETLATVFQGRGYATGAFVSASVLARRYGLGRTLIGERVFDIDRGIDPLEMAPRPLARLGKDVFFGFPPGEPPRDPGGERLDRLDDPIRFNRSDLASFSPRGTSTPGTVYLTDGRYHLAAARVNNRAGKVSVLRYDRVLEVWR